MKRKRGYSIVILHPPFDFMANVQALFVLQGLPQGPSPHFAEFTTTGLITAGFLYSIIILSLFRDITQKYTFV